MYITSHVKTAKPVSRKSTQSTNCVQLIKGGMLLAHSLGTGIQFWWSLAREDEINFIPTLSAGISPSHPYIVMW